MDVRNVMERVPEPALTRSLRDQLQVIRGRLSPAQREAMLRWEDAIQIPADTLNAVRRDVDSAEQLRNRAARFAAAADKTPLPDDRIADVVATVAHATDKPAVASALVWHLVGGHDEDFASHVIQVIRERAGLPRLGRKLVGGDGGLSATASAQELVAWFSDRQASDTCAQIEAITAPLGPEDAATLERQIELIAAARQTTTIDFAGFARRAAAFFVTLSARGLDPLGFPLEREVQLVEPPVARRIEICAWARRAGHLISPRGKLLVLAISITSPWPWRLELIAAEPGHGASGCLALLLRLDGPAPNIVTERVPVLLLVPGESDEERGARFERWLAVAYPQATAEWRTWM